MNIKSLILGSAAALVAGGAAQAADLPVAEPVDYVKVCNAYGAGYHFIPGTDTCLKVSGYVRAEFRFDEPQARTDNTTNIYAKASLNFTAKEETELGTLVAYMRLENDTNGGNNDGFNKYYMSIGGLYAGLTDSAANITTTDKAMYGSTLGDHDTGAIGYNMDLGNGVSATVAVENRRGSAIVGGAYAGQSLPDVVAALSISQGWGSAKIGGAVQQIRFANSAVDTDYGYYVGAGINFNLDMLSAGSEIGFSAGYAKGAVGYINSSVAGVNVVGTNVKQNDIWQAGVALKYAWASNFNTYLTGSYQDYNNKTTKASDFNSWDAGFVAEYLPVKNLIVRAGVKYSKKDYSATSGMADAKNWEGKLRLQRNF
ncbi:MAG: porin [Cohaesibacter sp.]|nr:porin [Cohaesibacter sp.]MCV6600756.1 porin [Cohaesibacter sp.]